VTIRCCVVDPGSLLASCLRRPGRSLRSFHVLCRDLRRQDAIRPWPSAGKADWSEVKGEASRQSRRIQSSRPSEPDQGDERSSRHSTQATDFLHHSNLRDGVGCLGDWCERISLPTSTATAVLVQP